jgi:hypothetical protein
MINKFEENKYYFIEWPDYGSLNDCFNFLIKIERLLINCESDKYLKRGIVLASDSDSFLFNSFELGTFYVPVDAKAASHLKKIQYYSKKFDYKNIFKYSYEVSQKDLPLYVGWKYVSPELFKEILR